MECKMENNKTDLMISINNSAKEWEKKKILNNIAICKKCKKLRGERK